MRKQSDYSPQLYALAGHFWKTYEYMLPVSPGDMAWRLLQDLLDQGWTITKQEGEPKQ